MKIFKLDTKGKLRFLEVTTVGSSLIQTSGIKDTLNPVIHTKECKGKNIGKSNETSASEQAVLEANAIIKDKLTEGYFNTIEEAESVKVILPMLAKSYDDEKHKINWIKDDIFIQRKYDGQRCLAIIKSNEVTLISRDGKVIENMNHIKDSLKKLIKSDTILDGELYSKELGTFQENMKAIKKYRKGITEKIKYNVYDLIDDKQDMTFLDRNNLVEAIVQQNDNIVLCETFPIKFEKDIIRYHKVFLAEGFEGSIIRLGSSLYKINGRSSGLLKYKDFQDITATIIDILPNEANPKHGTPLLKHNNSTFKAGVKMSHEDREDLLINKVNYIGKTAEIRFFEWTDDGNPRFPIMVGIRLDK